MVWFVPYYMLCYITEARDRIRDSVDRFVLDVIRFHAPIRSNMAAALSVFMLGMYLLLLASHARVIADQQTVCVQIGNPHL